MGGTLIVIGLIMGLVGYVWIVVTAFQESILWGIGSLIPIISLIYVITHWERAGKPFLLALAGTALRIAGAMMSN